MENSAHLEYDDIDRSLDHKTAENILNHVWGIHAEKIGELGPTAFLVQTDTAAYVFKRHASHCTDNAKALGKIYAEAGKSNLAPTFIPANNDCLFYRKGRNLYSLQNYVCTIDKKPTPEDAGIWLATLHRSLSNVNIQTIQNHFDRSLKNLSSMALEYGLNEAIEWLKKAEILSNLHQVIHGDLHSGNIVLTSQGIVALDFDSATTNHPALDVAFLGYRLYGPDSKAIKMMVDAYTKCRPGWNVNVQNASILLLFAVVQRILFICQTSEQGSDRWLYDLENQKTYYKDAKHLIDSYS